MRNLAEKYIILHRNEVYHEKESIDDGIGNIDWRLAICLLASWIFIFISLIKGVESAGKVSLKNMFDG